jgi:hypothetical protein
LILISDAERAAKCATPQHQQQQLTIKRTCPVKQLATQSTFDPLTIRGAHGGGAIRTIARAAVQPHSCSLAVHGRQREVGPVAGLLFKDLSNQCRTRRDKIKRLVSKRTEFEFARSHQNRANWCHAPLTSFCLKMQI